MVRAPFARWTMPAVFFREVATRHDAGFNDVKLTSQFMVLIVKLECLIRITKRKKKILKEFISITILPKKLRICELKLLASG